MDSRVVIKKLRLRLALPRRRCRLAMTKVDPKLSIQQGVTMQKVANSNLHDAKKNKKDEFYTQLSDIENKIQLLQRAF